MIRVKICGIRTQDTLQAVADAGADWVGLNFYPPSPRYLTPAQAASLEGGPARVGLFVDPTEDDIAAALAVARLDILQVHASAERAAELRARFGLPVWHVVGVQSRADLPLSAATDALLLDAKPPPGADRPGGNARPFDWSVLQGWRAPVPWLLAGGLTPETVAEAVSVSGAAAVDVSSGVESAPGVKDAGLIRAFVAAAKSAA